MITPDNYLYILLGLGIVFFILYYWKIEKTDEWLYPLLLIGGVLITLFGFYFVFKDLYTDQLKTDSKFFYTSIISAGVGIFSILHCLF